MSIATLPTDTELREAREVLSQATKVLLPLASRVKAFVRAQYTDESLTTINKSATPPTFEQIGTLLSFGQTLPSYTRECDDYIDELGGMEALAALDAARQLHETKKAVIDA